MQTAFKTVEKLSATKLAIRHNLTTGELQRRLIGMGYIEVRSGLHYFTDIGISAGGECWKNHPGASDSDGHMVWPADVFDVSAAKG